MEQEALTCSGACLLYLPLAIVPSLIWLLFFVAQDRHREKPRNIVRIFLWGVIVAFPIAFVEVVAERTLVLPFAAAAFAPFVYSFVVIAFVEEGGKYLVVKYKAVGKKFFDEPSDAIIYMVTAALGFAAIENIFYAQNVAPLIAAEANIPILSAIMRITTFRGISATFLHVAASGTLGYFLALSMFNRQERKKFLYIGILLATLLHGIYNNFIMDIQGRLVAEDIGGLFGVVLISLLLAISGIIILVGLHKLLNMHFSKNNEKLQQ